MLSPRGWIIFELGMGQMDPVRRIIEESESLEFVKSIKDYNDIDRICVARSIVSGR